MTSLHEEQPAFKLPLRTLQLARRFVTENRARRSLAYEHHFQRVGIVSLMDVQVTLHHSVRSSRPRQDPDTRESALGPSHPKVHKDRGRCLTI